MPKTPMNPKTDERFEQIVAEILEAEESGGTPDLGGYLERFPDLAERLRDFFRNRKKFNRLAPLLVPALPETTPYAEPETVPPNAATPPAPVAFDLLAQAGEHRAVAEALWTRFEQSWDETRLTAEARRLPPSGHPLRLLLLRGLVRIDMRRHWQRGQPVPVEAYLRAYPELGSAETVPVDLLVEEYEARRLAGQPAEWSDFARRFPNQAIELQRQLNLARPSTTDGMGRGSIDSGSSLEEKATRMFDKPLPFGIPQAQISTVVKPGEWAALPPPHDLPVAQAILRTTEKNPENRFQRNGERRLLWVCVGAGVGAVLLVLVVVLVPLVIWLAVRSTPTTANVATSPDIGDRKKDKTEKPKEPDAPPEDPLPEERPQLLEDARAFVREGKWAEATAAFSRALVLQDDAGVRSERGHMYGVQGRWEQAAADFTRALELQPYYVSHWYHALIVQAQLGNKVEYRRLGRGMVKRFGDTADPRIAEATVKACFLLPDVIEEREQLAKLAEVAVTQEPNDVFITFFFMAKGLAEYRAGRYREAAEWMEKSLAAKNQWIAPAASGRFVLAMTKQQRGQFNDAKVTLAQAQEITAKQIAPLKTSPRAWWDWVINELLRREAEALIAEKKPEPKK